MHFFLLISIFLLVGGFSQLSSMCDAAVVVTEK
jgi:hypothetical protein